MKPSELAVQSLPLPVPSDKAALPFPKRSTVAELRRLREKCFRDGHHELALQAATEVARRDPGRESFCRQGMLLREVGRYREALGVLRDALRFETGPAYLIADIHLHIAHTWTVMGKRKRAGESLRRAYALRLKPRTAFNYHISCGNFQLSKNRLSDALREFSQAEKVAPNVQARGRAAINQGIVHLRQWDFKSAQEPLNRALRMLKRAGHAAELAIARQLRAHVCSELGQDRRALGMLLRTASSCRRLGKVDREAEVLGQAGYIAGRLQLWGQSRSILDRCISLASVTGQHSVLSCAYSNRAIACAYNEDFDPAEASLAQGQRLLRGRRDGVATLHACRAQAKIAALKGRWKDVLKVSRRAERVATKAGDAVRVVEFRKLRAEAEQHLGRGKAAAYARKTAGRLQELMKVPKGLGVGRLAAKLAGTSMPVLIVGDPGTNKRELAQEMHRKSARASKACVVVPCEQLTFPASDLNGHAEGAWSGASRASEGFVSKAQGGTLILDCVDQMDEDGQRVLLPLIDGKTRTVGGTSEQSSGVRIVATCTSTERLIPELRRRLEGALLRIPALRDQKDEIPRQVREQLAGRREVTPDAMAELSRHPWEGNATELRNLVERLVAFSEGKIGRKLVRRFLTTPKSRLVGPRVHASREPRAEALLAL